MAPAFSPDIHDYVLRCSAGDNAVSVTVNAAAPVEASILGVGSSPASGSQSATVTLQEDSAIVIDVTSGTDAQEYWVRCLPHDFPVVSMTRNPQAGSPTPGWYLLGNGIAAEGEGGFAMVLDGNGTPVWYHRVAATGAFNVDQLPDGSISFIAELGAYGSDPNAKYTILQLAPWQVQYVQASGSPTDEHELQVLPNGDRLVLSYPLIAGVDLTGLASYGADSTIADCVIEELDQAGALVWQWRGSDHIDPVKESTSPSRT